MKKFLLAYQAFLFKKISLWIFLLCSILLTIAATIGLFIISERDYFITRTPKLIQLMDDFVFEIKQVAVTTKKFMNTGTFEPRILETKHNPGAWFSEGADLSGQLLISAFDAEVGQSVVYLYNLEERRIKRKWLLGLQGLMELTSQDYELTPSDLPRSFRAQHPIITSDGGIIASSGEGLLAKFSEAGEVVWHIERHFHHSIEEGIEPGQYISQIIVKEPVILPNGNAVTDLRNDGYVIFSDDGRILEERSITQILVDNNYFGLLFGSKWEKDRIHLNDAEFITKSDRFVQKGDIMLSARNLSAVMLYRPSTNKLVWLKQGPFLNQHDIDYLGSGRFLIFGNDNLRTSDKWMLNKHSSAYIYDMENDKVEKFLTFTEIDLSIDTQGRLDRLKNDHFFVDDAERIFILNRDGEPLFRYIHSVNNTKAGALHWSRYLHGE